MNPTAFIILGVVAGIIIAILTATVWMLRRELAIVRQQCTQEFEWRMEVAFHADEVQRENSLLHAKLDFEYEERQIFNAMEEFHTEIARHVAGNLGIDPELVSISFENRSITVMDPHVMDAIREACGRKHGEEQEA